MRFQRQKPIHHSGISASNLRLASSKKRMSCDPCKETEKILFPLATDSLDREICYVWPFPLSFCTATDRNIRLALLGSTPKFLKRQTISFCTNTAAGTSLKRQPPTEQFFSGGSPSQDFEFKQGPQNYVCICMCACVCIYINKTTKNYGRPKTSYF